MNIKQTKVADLSSTYEIKPDSLFDKPVVTDERSETNHSGLFVKQIKEFTEKTSCHGVNRIADQQSPNNWFHWKNILWFFLTVTSLGMASQSLATILEDYNSYPTSTVVASGYEPMGEFPSVTLCNLNLVMPGQMPGYSNYADYWRRLHEEENNTLDHHTRLDHIISAFAALSNEDKKTFGHSIQEMLIECKFGGEECTVDDFHWSYSPKYGNCYSFNFGFDSSDNDQPVRRAMTTGIGSGLVVTLDVQSDRYLDMTPDIGITFMTHPSRIFPYIEETGVVASPGFLTSVGLKKTSLNAAQLIAVAKREVVIGSNLVTGETSLNAAQLIAVAKRKVVIGSNLVTGEKEDILAEPPYGICMREDSERNKNLNMYASTGYRYSVKTCRDSCEQAHVMKTCGCCERNIPCNPDGLTDAFGITLPNDGNLSVCNVSDWDDSRCMTTTLSNVQRTGACSGKCFPECKYISFEAAYSVATWPNRKQTDDFFQIMNGSGRLIDEGRVENSNNISVQDKYSFLRENLVRLDVNFGTLSKTVTSTQPRYTWNLLLSNVGGQLGLWLGFSVLTAIEYVEFLFDAVVFGIKAVCGRKRSPAVV